MSSEVHSLPPGVQGERRGEVSLVVDEIIWLVEVDSPARLRAEWWGSEPAQQAVFSPVDVRNFTMVVAGGSMLHTYPVYTGREKLRQYLTDASPLLLSLTQGGARARVPVTVSGLDGYFPLLDTSGQEVAHIHVKMTYRDGTEAEQTSQEVVKETASGQAGRKPLLRTQRLGRYQRPKSSSSSSPGKENSPIKKKQKPNRVTFSSKTLEGPKSQSQPNYKTPITDSLITSLLNESSTLRQTMKHQLEMAQLDLDNFSDDGEDNTENIDPSVSDCSPRDSLLPRNPPIKSLSVFLKVNLVSVELQTIILDKLKATPKHKPLFVPASKSRSARNPESNSSLAIIVKVNFPNKKETNFCSRKFNKNTAEFNETALEPVVIDQSWRDLHITLSVHCRLLGQKETILVGSASLGCKHLLSDSSCSLETRPVSLNIYCSQSLFRKLQLRPEECREVVGLVNVGFKLTSVEPARTNKAPSPQKISTMTKTTTSTSTSTSTSMPERSRSPVMLESRARPAAASVTPGGPVLVSLSLTAQPGLSLKVRWWTGRLVEAENVLISKETLLVPGEEARMINRQTVSALRDNCLVVEVWAEDDLVGISRLPTQSLASAAADWSGQLVTCYSGGLEVVRLSDGEILGSLDTRLTVGYSHQLEPVRDQETMTVSQVSQETVSIEEQLKELDKPGPSPSSHEETVHIQDSDKVTDTARTADDVSQISSSSSEAEGKFLAEISVEEGRMERRGGLGVYCSLPGGERSPVSLSDSPVWALSVETEVSVQFLVDSQHQLVIRVWLTQSDCPHPDTDSMLGFAAVDLSPLLSFPVLSGWYNVINWAGKCRGQLKVTVRPLESLSRNNNTETLTTSYSPTSSVLPPSETPVSQQSLCLIPQSLDIPREESLHWSPPQSNSVQDQPASISFLESSLARNLMDLESLTSRLVVEQIDEEDNHEPPVCAERLEDVSLSMLQSRISSHLSCLQVMARQEERCRVERQELPPSLGESEDSDRSRVGPEGGNTES